MGEVERIDMKGEGKVKKGREKKKKEGERIRKVVKRSVILFFVCEN